MIKIESNPTQDYVKKALSALAVLESRDGEGSDFLGWLDLPVRTSDSIIGACEEITSDWRKKGVEVVVVIGIGGSYLGAKAAIGALSHTFLRRERGGMEILFAGQNLSEEYHAELLEYIEGKSIACVVISKSGTTTEPAVAFRVIKELMEKIYSAEEAASRIVAVTDKSRGALKNLSDSKGYRRFVIPDDVGGRFSVLTPVGLLPIALAGFDIRTMMRGAAAMAERCSDRSGENPAVRYAAFRNELYDSGKKIEIMVNYNPKLLYLGEWWKQLFGESEGKEGKGIFPASVSFTTDLHSMGQYIQEGERILFETVLSVASSHKELKIGKDPNDLDGLNFLAGRGLEYCNRMAEIGTRLAHIDGGVPNMRIEMEKIDEYTVGELFFFFEKACGISAYMLGVNPFNQPGVEAYKKNMFALLDKPGYEEASRKIKERL